ncbi:CPBP family intramembrane glutamic endopeptidase [Halolactibacillus miurensis]|nr:CPBP family intramembrane glutamic endopeptidase [Halolactibacillus miurensis]
MKANRINLRLKKIILLSIWVIIYFKINFGVMRSTVFLALLENDQFFLNLIMILIIYLFCRQELDQSLKELNLSMIKKTLLTLIVLILTIYIYMTLVFDSFEVASQNYTIEFLFAAIIIAPLREELIYRYLFLSVTDSKMGKIVLGVISVLLFVYGHRHMHNGNLLAMMQVVFLSLGTIFLYLKEKNIFTAIVLHVMFNAFVIIMSLIY